MTLRTDDVARQLPAVVTRFREQAGAFAGALEAANEALGRWDADPDLADTRIRAAMAENARPYALSLGEPPGLAHRASAFTPVTVVAADGSSIEPDRFAPLPCFVISIGEAVLPYGVPGAPVLASRAMVGPFATSDEGQERGGESVAFGWGVNLQRDARELGRGAELAAERTQYGPVVLLLDGTLFPWDLDSRQVAEDVRREAVRRTQEALDSVYVFGAAVSMGAYISASRSSDVVTSLRALAGRDDLNAVLPSDATLFATLLQDGERSALFRARSERGQRVEDLFTTTHEVCFFYLRVGGDLARVELPHWATSAAQVDRLHATIVDQCRRCDGYPRVLQEAHEQAVISMGDRLQFGRLLDAEAARQGVHAIALGKHLSKRRRAV